MVTTSFPENYNYMLGSNSGSSVEYSEVESYQKDSLNNNLGKKVSNFSTWLDETPSTYPFNTISNDWRRGQLTQERDYAYQNSNYVLVKQANNYYTTRYTDSLVRGYTARIAYKPLLGVYQGCTSVATSYCPSSDFYNQLSTVKHTFNYLALDYQIGSIFLDSTITTTYSETGINPVTDLVKNEYAYKTHQQVTKQTHISSEKDKWSSIFRYPHEKQSGTNVYNDMVNRHIYTPIIEEEKLVNDTTTSITRTNYKKWYSTTTFGNVTGFFAPLSVEMQYAGGNFITEIVFGEKLVSPTENGYDLRGHPLVYTELAGQTTRMTWWETNGKYDLLKNKSVQSLFSTDYDYFPLIGLKSERNQNNYGFDYSYDAFNRLSIIKESTGNILKSFKYHYTTNANCN